MGDSTKEMTGYSPIEAKQELDALLEYGKKAFIDATNCLNAFYRNLYDNWCSPKAVEFETHNLRYMRRTISDIQRLYLNIYRSATDAYNIIARANSSEAIPLEDDENPRGYIFEGGWSGVPDGSIREANEAGVVGMNTANVKIARDLFMTKMNEIIDFINNTPMKIAFYDPNGEIAGSYRKEIEMITNVLYEALSNCIKSINEAIETESNTLTIAKQNAIDSLTA